MALWYKKLLDPLHPLAGKNGQVDEQRVVLFAKIGDGWHNCHWCGDLVRWQVGLRNTVESCPLFVDHLDRDIRNNDPGNLVPSCMICNMQRHRSPSPKKERANNLPSTYYKATILGHPLSNINGRVPVHRATLHDAMQGKDGACHWCGTPIIWKGGGYRTMLCVDHLDGDRHNNEPSNLVPSCRTCNVLRNHPSKILAGELYIDSPTGRTRASVSSCSTCGKEFLTRNYSLKNPLHGRFCSKRCIRTRPLAANEIRTTSKNGKATICEVRICKNCNSEFHFPTEYRNKPGSTGEYCSRKCYFENTKGPLLTLSCEQCCKSFSMPQSKLGISGRIGKFCSRTCLGMYRKDRHIHPNGPTFPTCHPS